MITERLERVEAEPPLGSGTAHRQEDCECRHNLVVIDARPGGPTSAWRLSGRSRHTRQLHTAIENVPLQREKAAG